MRNLLATVPQAAQELIAALLEDAAENVLGHRLVPQGRLTSTRQQESTGTTQQGNQTTVERRPDLPERPRHDSPGRRHSDRAGR